MAITLEKRGEAFKLDLSKENQAQLRVDINLNWNGQSNFQEVKRTGFFSKFFGGGNSSSGPDLDLGCIYELNDGSIGVIQPLDKNFGSLKRPPYIFLDKDDRTGAAADGENMTIVRPDMIKRVLVFAMIYSGAEDFRKVEGRLHFKVSNGQEIYIDLDNPSNNLVWCAGALIKFTSSGIILTKEERYYSWAEEADDYYGFGITWQWKSK